MLTDTLRGEWGFDGHVISDCDTLGAVEAQFHWTSCLQQSVAQSVLAGNGAWVGGVGGVLPTNRLYYG